MNDTIIFEDKSIFDIMKLIKIFFLTNGCFVSQCLKTFKTLIVDAVLTIVYSFVFCSLILDIRGFPAVVGCGDAELPNHHNNNISTIHLLNTKEDIPGVLAIRSILVNFGDSPDVATANACVAATELIRRRDDLDDVTTTPGKTIFNEPSAACRILCRGDARTSLKRFAKRRIQ